MNDHKAMADTKVRSRFSPLAIVLFLVAVVGAYVSAGKSRTLSELQREQTEFFESFGEMRIEDPSRVAIVAVPPTATELPVWVDPENVWIFRIYIPANYGVAWARNVRLVAADSPLSDSNGGGSTHGSQPEAKEIQMVVSTDSTGGDDGRLKCWLMSDSGSSSFLLPKKLAFDSPDELVLDTVVEPGEPTRTFADDEAICVWRIRNKTPGNKMLNNTKLYPGCAIYLYEASRRDAFMRWANGKSSSMTDTAP